MSWCKYFIVWSVQYLLIFPFESIHDFHITGKNWSVIILVLSLLFSLALVLSLWLKRMNLEKTASETVTLFSWRRECLIADVPISLRTNSATKIRKQLYRHCDPYGGFGTNNCWASNITSSYVCAFMLKNFTSVLKVNSTVRKPVIWKTLQEDCQFLFILSVHSMSICPRGINNWYGNSLLSLPLNFLSECNHGMEGGMSLWHWTAELPNFIGQMVLVDLTLRER